MNQLQVFNNTEFGRVRAMVINGSPWFVAKDVCECLDINNSRQALARLDSDEKNSVILNDGTPGNPEKGIVNEYGLYSLVLSSRKPSAKAFRSLQATAVSWLANWQSYLIRTESISDRTDYSTGSVKTGT